MRAFLLYCLEVKRAATLPIMTTIPTIHLNGTGFTTLRDEYAAAYDAINKAINALANATCNGRDYYPQGEQAFYDAREERQEAFNKLCEVKNYAAEMLAGICDQQR
jgi:hypothetical protein